MSASRVTSSELMLRCTYIDPDEGKQQRSAPAFTIDEDFILRALEPDGGQELLCRLDFEPGLGGELPFAISSLPGGESSLAVLGGETLLFASERGFTLFRFDDEDAIYLMSRKGRTNVAVGDLGSGWSEVGQDSGIPDLHATEILVATESFLAWSPLTRIETGRRARRSPLAERVLA